jgi:hypothetical protein
MPENYDMEMTTYPLDVRRAARGVASLPMPYADPVAPGNPAPKSGWYEELSDWGTPTGNRLYIGAGNPVPGGRWWYAWRLVHPPNGTPARAAFRSPARC